MQWSGEDGNPKQMIGIGERVRVRKVDWRIPETIQPVTDCRGVPRENPRVQQRVADIVRQQRRWMENQREGRHKSDCDEPYEDRNELGRPYATLAGDTHDYAEDVCRPGEDWCVAPRRLMRSRHRSGVCDVRILAHEIVVIAMV